jgi:aminopeptidase N
MRKSTSFLLNILFLLCLLLFARQTIFAQQKIRSYLIDSKLAPREHNVDFTNLRIEVSFDPGKGIVKGKVTERFRPLQLKTDSIVLDAIDMNIQEVLLNGKAVRYINDKTFLRIFPSGPLSWETTDSLCITYEATPSKGLYFIGWNDPGKLSRKQIWSQGQGTDNRYWIPMYDEMNDKLISEVIVRFDKEYKVLSNGKCLGIKDNKDGTLSWHYAMSHPHAPYLIMLAIGKYDIKETNSKSGVPMHLYYYPEWKDRVESTYKYSEQMLDFYEKEIGVPYGWESYSQIPVQDYMFGAMENTTATVYGDFYCVDPRSFIDRSYIGTNSHELAHQWFGDLVTANSDAHHWLQESFATYYSELFEAHLYGRDHFLWSKRLAQHSSLEESARNNYPIAHSDAGTVRHYPKGALVLDMLKYVCGSREEYNKAIKFYLEQHKYKNVDSDDLLKAFRETLGLSLDWFWEEWVYRGGEPQYTVSFEENTNASRFLVQQTQELSDLSGMPVQGNQKANTADDPFVSPDSAEYRPAGLYKMPIWFEVHYTDGSMDRKQVMIEQQTERVSVPNTGHKKIDYVLFDPDNNVLKSVKFTKPFDMLVQQALKAPGMLDRYDALLAMKSMPLEKKREMLLKVYDRETFQACKTEVIAQLASDPDPLSQALLEKALRDKDVAVRKAALKEIHALSPALLPKVELLLRDSSYELVAEALQKLVAGNPANSAAYLETTKGIQGTAGKNVGIRHFELSYSTTNDKKQADSLVAYTSNSYEFRTRINAMMALKRINYFDLRLAETLSDAILSPNGRLSNPAAETLTFFFAQDKNTNVIRDYLNAKTWKEQQKKKLAAYL